MILITGATGHVGSELLPLLLDMHQDIRILTRDANKIAAYANRAEIIEADLDKPASLDTAFTDVSSLFLLVTGERMSQFDNALAAAHRHNVKHIVYLSSMGVGAKPPLTMDTNHAKAEQLLRRSDVKWTIVRAGFMMANCLGWAETIKSEGNVHDGFGKGMMTPIDPYDMAKVISTALTEQNKHVGEIYELTGQEHLNTPQMVMQLANVLGRELTYTEHTPEDMTNIIIRAGVPEPFARTLQESMERTRQDEFDITTDTVQQITGQSPRTFRQWSVSHKSFFV